MALNLELDDDLRREGLAREVVHSVQAARKAAGLEVSDSIALTLAGDAELIDAARAHEPYVAGETLASELSFDGADASGGATPPRSTAASCGSGSSGSSDQHVLPWRRYAMSGRNRAPETGRAYAA